MAEQLLGLLAVFGLLGAAVWAFGRRNGRSWPTFGRTSTSSNAMQRVERLVLTPQHTLHLVRIGEKILVLATHPAGVVFEPAGTDFSSELRNMMVRPQGEYK